MSRELLQQALDALKPMKDSRDDTAIQRAITALEQELAKPEQSTLESVIQAHIKDLQGCVKALEDYPQFAATRLEICKAVEELGSALSGPEQAEKLEPVGSVVTWLDGSLVHGWFGDPPPVGTLLYTAPPRKPWASLNNAYVCGYASKFIDRGIFTVDSAYDFVQLIELACKGENE
jgi:hypothetical protein